MLFVTTLRFSRGYVCFEAVGAATERFYDMAIREGIHLWDLHRDGMTLRANVAVRDYRRLRRAARRTGTRLKIAKRHGAPFWAHRYRKRVGLVLGVLLFLGSLSVMSNFIWEIQVTGNDVIPSQEILQVLETLGVKQGAYRPGLDIRSIERNAMLQLQRLSWIAINISGSTAVVEVRERVMPPEMMPDDDVPCNVVARYTGQIRQMQIFDGQSVVKVGDTVQAGDLIVSGILQNKYGTAILKHARAKVIAEVEDTIQVTVEKNQTV